MHVYWLYVPRGAPRAHDQLDTSKYYYNWQLVLLVVTSSSSSSITQN